MKYKRVYSTFRHGDLALIKSILKGNNINYYVLNEWSGGMYPHGSSMDVMVAEMQVKEAKELIEDFKEETK